MAAFELSSDFVRNLMSDASSVPPTGDPALASQVRNWLAQQAQIRAAGGATPAVTAAPIATSATSGFGARALQVLKAPVTVKGAATGAMSVGRGLMGPLAWGPSAVSGAASALAGGNASNVISAAADPMLPVRALAERYANLAPQFMGGLSPESITAGNSQGASDIGGDFVARAAPPMNNPNYRPPRPVAGFGATPGSWSDPVDQFGQPVQPGPGEAITGARKGEEIAPAGVGVATSSPTTGAIIKMVDPKTGRVTYTDAASTPGAMGTTIANRVSTIPVAPGGGFPAGPAYAPGGPTRPYGDQETLNTMSQPDPLSAARQAAAMRGDWGAVASSYQANGGTWQGRTAVSDQAAMMLANAQAAVDNAPNARAKQVAVMLLDSIMQNASREKMNANTITERRDAAAVSSRDRQDKLLQELYGPAAMKLMTETQRMQELSRIGAGITDPVQRASFFGGHAVPQPHAAQVPIGIQPATLDTKNPIANIFDPNSGTVRSTPITPITSTPQRITMKEARASAKANGKPDDPGSVRRAIQAMPGYRLVD